MPKRANSNMVHQFSQVPKADIQRASFNRSHGLKTTFDVNKLVPIYCDEALPGDTFNLKMSGFARLATPITPIMDNMYMDTFFFAVPNRILWDNWEKFNGAQDNPGDSIDFSTPQVVIPIPIPAQSLHDYLGLPVNTGNMSVSAFWHRAYNKIFDDWFRDENLQNSLTPDTGDGPDDYLDYQVLTRGKRHDYFTSALPWPAKDNGTPVTLPLGTSAPIGTGPGINQGDTGDVLIGSLEAGAGGRFMLEQGATNVTYGVGNISREPNLFADLSEATAATINEIRQAFQIQRLQERDARGGTRYVEILKAHFNVTSPDSRLQRSEFLGGGTTYVNINPVAQTSGSPGETDYTPTPQGNLAAYGTASFNGHGFTKSFTEHMTIIGLVNVRADLTYQQGINKMFLRQTRYDYYWPALSHIGEQVVETGEIYYTGTETDDDVFGYQERYAEYRYKPSQITGKFRSAATDSLDVWHLSQDFETTPSLNSAFILDNTPIDRVVAVPTEPDFLFDAHFNLQCARPMPVYGVPGFVDHF